MRTYIHECPHRNKHTTHTPTQIMHTMISQCSLSTVTWPHRKTGNTEAQKAKISKADGLGFGIDLVGVTQRGGCDDVDDANSTPWPSASALPITQTVSFNDTSDLVCSRCSIVNQCCDKNINTLVFVLFFPPFPVILVSDRWRFSTACSLTLCSGFRNKEKHAPCCKRKWKITATWQSSVP